MSEGKRIKSPCSREFLVLDGDEFKRGRRLAQRTYKWMREHKATFFTLYEVVKNLQRRGVKACARDQVKAYCEAHNIRVSDNPGVLFDNSLWAGISRYLVLHDQSLRKNPIALRKSNIDYYGLYAIAYLPETMEE